MISNAMVDFLNGKSGLNKKTNLFAENGKGEKHVVISTTTQNALDPTLSFVRHAPISVIVAGYNITDGSILAEFICTELEKMTGTYTYTIKTGVVETYDITSVTVRNWPALTKAEGCITFSANLVVYYKKS